MVKRTKNNQDTGMVDITLKKLTKRIARACCNMQFSKKAYNSLVNDESPKGDVLAAAKIAGILAAKSTSSLIPMCHPLQINKAIISFKMNKKKATVTIFSEIVCEAKTGAEMEALISVSIAALTVYDMMKWADKGIVISELKLLSKSGGKSGDYVSKD